MQSPNLTARHWLLRLAALLLICLLALGGGCRRGEGMTVDLGSSNDNVFLTTVVVVMGFVGLGLLAASDLETGAAAALDFDCAVTNQTGIDLAMYADGRPVGLLEPDQRVTLNLGPGPHDLCWQVAGVDSGGELHQQLEIGQAPGYYTVALHTD